MARVNATQWLEKWKRRMDASGQDMAAGVDRVTVAPGESAAQAQERFAQRMMESIQNGSWARGVRGVSLNDWKQAMKDKGIARIGQGTAQAVRTKQGRIAATLAAVDQAAAAANALPKGNIENSIARATTFMRTMSNLAPKKTGGGNT